MTLKDRHTSAKLMVASFRITERIYNRINTDKRYEYSDLCSIDPTTCHLSLSMWGLETLAFEKNLDQVF
jgi:hypothetical protein